MFVYPKWEEEKNLIYYLIICKQKRSKIRKAFWLSILFSISSTPTVTPIIHHYPTTWRPRFHRYSSFLHFASLFPQCRRHNTPKGTSPWHAESDTALLLCVCAFIPCYCWRRIHRQTLKYNLFVTRDCVKKQTHFARMQMAWRAWHT